MIPALPLEYTCARAAARLAMRPDERLWQQLHSARSLAALLDIARAAPIAPWLTGVGPMSTFDEIELAFRQQWRARVDELSGWTPQAWRAAVSWTRALIDLPALQHLAGEATPPDWIGADPVLATYVQDQAATQREARLARLAAGPLAPVVTAMRTATPARRAARSVLPDALAGWRLHWRVLWPPQHDESRGALEELADTVGRHALHFGGLDPDDAAAARATLEHRMRLMLRRHPGAPVALFAWLALLALDLERLRGECVLHAARAWWAAHDTALRAA